MKPKHQQTEVTRHSLVGVTVLIRNESTKRVTRYQLQPNNHNIIELIEYKLNGQIPSCTVTPVNDTVAIEVAQWLRSQYPDIVE